MGHAAHEGDPKTTGEGARKLDKKLVCCLRAPLRDVRVLQAYPEICNCFSEVRLLISFPSIVGLPGKVGYFFC